MSELWDKRGQAWMCYSKSNDQSLILIVIADSRNPFCCCISFYTLPFSSSMATIPSNDFVLLLSPCYLLSSWCLLLVACCILNHEQYQSPAAPPFSTLLMIPHSSFSSCHPLLLVGLFLFLSPLLLPAFIISILRLDTAQCQCTKNEILDLFRNLKKSTH